MTNIPSVEERVVEAMKGFGGVVQMTPDQNSEAIIYHQDEVEKMLTRTITALLTELRDSGLLEEKPVSKVEFLPEDGHNDLAKAIKVHINNLINPTIV